MADEDYRESLGGGVFDVLGNCFNETPLRTLVIQSVGYGDLPEVKARLKQVLDEAVDYEHIRSLIERKVKNTPGARKAKLTHFIPQQLATWSVVINWPRLDASVCRSDYKPLY